LQNLTRPVYVVVEPPTHGEVKRRENVAKEPALKLADLLPQERTTEATPEEIQKLADDILINGLKHAIVIFDGQVVDGLARIEAFKILGREEIPAMVSDKFEVLAPSIAKARTQVMSEGDAVTRLLILNPAIDRLVSYRRITSGGIKKSGVTLGLSIRELVTMATGLTLGKAEIARRLVRRASDPEVLKKIEQIKAGQTTLYGYLRWQQEGEGNELEPVATADEVRLVMNKGLRALATTVETLSKFGPASQLTLTERQKIMDSLSKSLRAGRKLGATIRKGMHEEMEETSDEG
jgi:hypothetical protein